MSIDTEQFRAALLEERERVERGKQDRPGVAAVLPAQPRDQRAGQREANRKSDPRRGQEEILDVIGIVWKGNEAARRHPRGRAEQHAKQHAALCGGGYWMDNMRSSATFVQCLRSSGTVMRLWTSPSTSPSSTHSR